jgi:transcriptional regulator with XRE-family HTH domain
MTTVADADRWQIMLQRLLRDRTQEQLAETLGVNRQTVLRWANGQRRPQPMARRAIEELARDEGLG